MPDMLHECHSLLKHRFLEAQEVVDIQGHAWSGQDRCLSHVGSLLVVSFKVALFDNST